MRMYNIAGFWAPTNDGACMLNCVIYGYLLNSLGLLYYLVLLDVQTKTRPPAFEVWLFDLVVICIQFLLVFAAAKKSRQPYHKHWPLACHT